jgi:ubiquinol-cytochrome c reductase cytochrome b subunit
VLRKAFDWLDERTGHRAWLSSMLDCPLPGGSKWARTFGVTALMLLILEAVTGIGLSLWYSPSVTDAWASVHFIHYKLELGWLLRGLHHFGGNALIVLVLLHLLQALVYGAYRAPRELTWISGVLVLQVLILASHSGYLLPWDLRSYWATQVLVGIAGNQPLVGPLAQRVIQGGDQVGNATLVHLYGLHIVIAPAGLLLGLALHFAQRKRTGAVVPATMSEADAAAKTQSYWPHQLVKDLFASLLVIGGVAAYTYVQHGPELSAPADPAIEYVARPEWYFLPIFYLRHWFTGSSEFIATALLPGVATVGLALLPFIAPKLEARTKSAHKLIVLGFAGGLFVTIGLGGVVAWEDAHNEAELAINAKADKLAEQAKHLAMIGVPVTGPTDLYQNDPVVWGQRVFARECAACHGKADETPYKSVLCLDGYASRTWIGRFLRQPRAPHFYGNTEIDEMDAVTVEDPAFTQLVEFVYSRSNRADADAEKAKAGEKVFEDEGCGNCHTLDGKGSGDAPDLSNWASEAYLAHFIRNPGAHEHYGKLNEMDAFDAEHLPKNELTAVVAYLRSQTDAQANYPKEDEVPSKSPSSPE